MSKKTITEWHEAKHEDAWKEEINYINSNPPKIGPFCGSKFAKNGHTKEGIQIFICSDYHERLMFWQKQYLILGKFPYLNGSNIYYILIHKSVRSHKNMY